MEGGYYMSQTIENRIVEMQFENKQFESGVQESLSTLDKLKKSLKFDDAAKNLQDFGKNTRNLDVSGITSSIEKLNDRFSASGIAGMEVIRNLTNFAIEAGKKIASALAAPFEQIKSGGWKRAMNIEDAKFQLKGLDIAWETVADDINYAVADTAFGLDAALGDPHYSWHPAVLIGKLIAALESPLRRRLPDTPRGQMTGGALLAASVITVSTAVPMVLLYAASRISKKLAWVLETFFCYQLLAARSLRDESMKVCRALEQGDTEVAREAVSMIVGRDTESLDEAGITRAAVETVAENTSDGVIAPMLFMAIGGAPLAFLYKAVNTMDSMIGYRNEKYLYFGRVAARLDDALNFLPSRISGLLMVLVSSPLGFDGKNAFRIFLRDRKKHASPNSAQTEAACAGALHLRLAGDASYGGRLHKKPYIGDDDRPIEAADIRRANKLMYGASAAALAVCVCIRIAAAVHGRRRR